MSKWPLEWQCQNDGAFLFLSRDDKRWLGYRLAASLSGEALCCTDGPHAPAQATAREDVFPGEES